MYPYDIEMGPIAADQHFFSHKKYKTSHPLKSIPRKKIKNTNNLYKKKLFKIKMLGALS